MRDDSTTLVEFLLELFFFNFMAISYFINTITNINSCMLLNWTLTSCSKYQLGLFQLFVKGEWLFAVIFKNANFRPHGSSHASFTVE